MIIVNNLSKKYGKIKAVRRISFSINKGEIVGIIGENGAGKTTTLRMLSTIVKPTSGTAYINDISVLSHPKDVRKEIGILFGGEVGLYDRLTTEENIRYFANLNKMDKSKIDSRVKELLNLFELQSMRNVRVGKFSRGMKQKVAMARSIVHDPKILLLDEPTIGLDVSTTKLIHDFILESKEKGKTIILSSHILNNVEKLCDKIILIDNGKIVEKGSFKFLREKYHEENIESIFMKVVGDKYV